MRVTAAAPARLALNLPHGSTAVPVSCYVLLLEQPARPFQYQAARAFGQGFDHAIVATQSPLAAPCDAYACVQ